MTSLNIKYQQQREKLIPEAEKLADDICKKYAASRGKKVYNKHLFNRVFLHTMDKLCYEKGVTHIKHRKIELTDKFEDARSYYK